MLRMGRIIASASAAPIAVTALHFGQTSTDATVYNSTGTTTPAANSLVLAFLACSDDVSPTEEPTSVTGNGLTWAQVGTTSDNEGTFRSISAWRAMGASPTTSTMTFTFAATKSGCSWSQIQLTNVDTSGSNGSGAIVQTHNAQTSPDAATHTNTLSSAITGSNIAICAENINGTAAITPEAGWTELSDVGPTTPGTRTQVQWNNTGDTSSTWSWSGNASASSICIEVKAAP